MIKLYRGLRHLKSSVDLIVSRLRPEKYIALVKTLKIPIADSVTKIECLHCLQPFAAVLEGLTSQSSVYE